MGWTVNKMPTTPTYKNPKTVRKLIFTDRLNTDYVADDEPIENLMIGYTPTYKDFIKQGLDPNSENNKSVYGIAKTLEPLTSRINKMKASIDNAGAGLQALKEKALAEIEAKKQQEQQGGAQDVPTTTEIQDN